MATIQIPGAQAALEAKYARRKGAASSGWYDWAAASGNLPVGQTGGTTVADIWTYKAYIKIPALDAGYTQNGNILLQFSRGDSYGNIKWAIGLKKGSEPAKTVTVDDLDAVLASLFSTASLGAYSLSISAAQWGSLQQDTYIVFLGYNQNTVPYYSCGNISNSTSAYPYVTIPCVNNSTGTLSASTLEVNGSNSLGLTITAHSTAYTHEVTWRLGSNSTTHSLAAGVTGDSLVIPTAWLDALPAATGGTLYVDLKTYSGGSQVGDTDTRICTVTVPSYALAPSRTLTGTDLHGGLYVQGKSGIAFAVTAAGVFGSTIASIVTTCNGSTLSGANGSFSPVAAGGNLDVVTTVTDSRGQTATLTDTITVYAWAYPEITAVSAYRCTAEGTASNTGTYVKVLLTALVSSLNGTNAFSATAGTTAFTLSGQSCTGASVILSGYSIASEYTIAVTVTDAYGSTATDVYIPSGARIFNIPAASTGDGIAFGKFADTAELLDSAWSIHSEGDVTAEGNIAAVGNIGAAGLTAALKSVIVDLLYPVGAIYISTVETSPGTLFGGTWSQITGRFLLAAGGSYTAGATGGNSKHKHMETIGWDANNIYYYGGNNGPYTGSTVLTAPRFTATPPSNTSTNAGRYAYTTEDTALPPYLVVYIWKRTA